MAINIDFYLKKRCEDIQIEKALRLEELYNDIDSETNYINRIESIKQILNQKIR